MENAKGRMFLFVVGIIMIVFGAFGIIVSLIALCFGDALNSLAGSTVLTSGLILLSLIGAIFELIVGILGVAYSKKPDKAMICIVLGIVYLIFEIMSDVLVSSSVWGIIFGVIIPVLYLIGAFKNKNSVNSLQ